MANLSGIFLIIQFLYAVLGMQLFGKVTQGDYLTNLTLTLALTLALTLTKVTQGDYLNADANFCTFGTASPTNPNLPEPEPEPEPEHEPEPEPEPYA